MSNGAQPIPKELVERMKEAGGTQLILNFRGGNDEGFLDFTLKGKDKCVLDAYDSYQPGEEGSLERDIDKWVWSAYSYSGAGEGYDYGDDYVYDFETGEVTHEFWHDEPVRHSEGSSSISFTLD